MEESFDFEITRSSIRNGRLYFERRYSDIFPKDSFGDRESLGGRGLPVQFLAGADIIESDIRYLGEVRIGPRKAFASFLKAIGAKEGAKLRVTRLAERKYRIEASELAAEIQARFAPAVLAQARSEQPSSVRVTANDRRKPNPEYTRTETDLNGVAHIYARKIYDAAIPVIRIFGLGGKRWKRNVAKGARIGPWLQAKYEIINERVWCAKGACLYMVAGADGVIRYFGISRNGIKHGWRTSPAYDADTMRRLPENQLFHSQCWKHIEAESKENEKNEFEVRVIAAEALVPILEKIGPPLSGFSALKGHGESVVASVERWFCNNRSASLAWWNVAMTS